MAALRVPAMTTAMEKQDSLDTLIAGAESGPAVAAKDTRCCWETAKTLTHWCQVDVASGHIDFEAYHFPYEVSGKERNRRRAG